jgi:multidrug efflux system outer membrane protein
MKSIELAYQARLLSYEDARKRLEIQVVKDFLGLITRKENIVYMEESLALSEQKLAKDRTARENGLLSELDWLNSRLSVETARYNLSGAEGTYQNALGEFLALLGMETGTDIEYEGTVEIAPVLSDPEKLIVDYLPKRPDIIARRQEIERLELSKNVTTLSSRSPSLNLSTTWQGGPESGEGLSGPFTDNISGSLSLRIPIDSWIPGTRQNQTVRAAGAEVEKAKLDLRDTETQAKSQIRSLISNLHNTWENIEIARLRVEIAERTFDATDEGFRNGTVESGDREDSLNELSVARQQLLQTEYSYQSLLLDLAAALNVDWKTLTRSLP